MRGQQARREIRLPEALGKSHRELLLEHEDVLLNLEEGLSDLRILNPGIVNPRPRDATKLLSLTIYSIRHYSSALTAAWMAYSRPFELAMPALLVIGAILSVDTADANAAAPASIASVTFLH